MHDKWFCSGWCRKRKRWDSRWEPVVVQRGRVRGTRADGNVIPRIPRLFSLCAERFLLHGCSFFWYLVWYCGTEERTSKPLCWGPHCFYSKGAPVAPQCVHQICFGSGRSGEADLLTVRNCTGVFKEDLGQVVPAVPNQADLI